MRKTVMPYANNKGADQPAHPRSLISAFVVRCLDRIISLLFVTEISSLYVAFVDAQAVCILPGRKPWRQVFSWRGSNINLVSFYLYSDIQGYTNMIRCILTHINLADFYILINWTSPFPILGVSVFFFRCCCFFLCVCFSVLFHFWQKFVLANSGDSDQKPRSAASDLGLHCLSKSKKWDARLIWVNNCVVEVCLTCDFQIF